MNSTEGARSAPRAFRWFLGVAFAWLTVTCGLGAGQSGTDAELAADTTTAATAARPESTVMPRPAGLERDVRFWIRVYTQVDTNGGFLHDQYNLGVVYETLHFDANTSPRQR